MRDDYPLPLESLSVFHAVVKAGGFAGAARQLGISPSAVSHRMRKLEQRLGMRLLNRSTRSVRPTAVGEGLWEALQTGFQHIEGALAEAHALQERVAGTVRLNVAPDVAQFLLWPRLQPLLAQHEGLIVEFVASSAFDDIVAQNCDAGVRLGEALGPDMVAVAISGPQRMLPVASPAWVARHGCPQTPAALHPHHCLGQRFNSGQLYAWEFERAGKLFRLLPDGPVKANDASLLVQAALAGAGVAFVFEGLAQPWLRSGKLVALLEEWCAPFEGFYLWYPSRRHHRAAFKAVLAALRVMA
ncbi:LysR family transcriptional regulator [Formicincola oecophyllae]|uniref:LysR family transcriptional regulator n=1 Tax=Formicincola oecophyllae TaxID=2558361 RepID=A0A4Y6U813_9PROT|nr:LysR family transcriptional regulator [Formicincola oecophyllae]QDH13304.1 LysR family transcriptional regulator [Formicincola oecophyllae]